MKIKASELQVGDVLVSPFPNKDWDRSVVVCTNEMNDKNYIEVEFARMGKLQHEDHIRCSTGEWKIDKEIEVTRITPATAHADEMLNALKELHGQLSGKLSPITPLHLRNLGELLEKIEPPKPPTVDELAEALRDVVGGSSGSISKAQAVLARLSLPLKQRYPEPKEATEYYSSMASIGWSKQDLINSGWTDEKLRKEGVIK